MNYTITICVLSLIIIAAIYGVYRLWENFDEILDMVIGLSDAIAQRDKDLEEMQKTLDEAKELIEVAKEATEMQLEAEKKFRDGIQSIIDF